MQATWIGGGPPSVPRGVQNGPSTSHTPLPPGLPGLQPIKGDHRHRPLPPGLPIRPPGLVSNGQSIPHHSSLYPSASTASASSNQFQFQQVQNQNSQIQSQLPFPHRPYHPIYNSAYNPHQQTPPPATTTTATSRTPSQTNSLSSYPASTISTPPLPPSGFPPPQHHFQPNFNVSAPPPPPNHPPNSHSTFLTLAMSSKEAAMRNVNPMTVLPPPTDDESTTDPSATLSRFAPIYNPLWLRQANTSIPTLVFPLPPSNEEETYTALIDDIYPPRLLTTFKQLEETGTERIKAQLSRNAKLSQSLTNDYASKKGKDSSQARLDLPLLSPSTYAAHWIPLQALEYSARQYELYESTLYNVLLRPYSSSSSTFSPDDSSSTIHLYSLPTPFIRESWPPVQMGDTCFLRPLIPEIQGWKGVEVEARVYAIERVKGEVVLSVDGQAKGWLKKNEEGGVGGEMEGEEGAEGERGIKVNVIWKIQDRMFEDWKTATEIVDMHLNNDNNDSDTTTKTSSGSNGRRVKTPRKRSNIESWLFPIHEDLSQGENDDDDDEEDLPNLTGRRWVDAHLNEEQKNAVRSILWAKHRAPLLISGPPGTGKTKTLVESVFQILKEYPNAHVLVCGASNPSTDTLALRLRSLMPSQLLRLNHPSRPFNEVRGELLPFCHVEGEAFGIPDVATLLSKRVICTTVLDCSILLSSRLTNSNLASLETHLSSRLVPDQPPALVPPHFNYLLIDEAGQAVESDLLPALAVVLTESFNTTSPAHVTICGDSNQLSPHIVSSVARDHDFDVSLLERLLRLPLYDDHPFSRKNRRKYPDLEWDLRTTPFVDLVRNYRSVEEILWLPSTLFYHETLLPFASETIQRTPLRNWSLLPHSTFPMVFAHTSGEDFEVEEGSSFFNPSEINLVVKLIQDLVRDGEERGHGKVSPKDVSVISPFREQVWRIRLALRKVNLGAVDVGNVEALQGAENRVVIISPVRSLNKRWIEHDRQTNRGLIFEPKRFNVAMTRAKELLIVVGNAQTLTVDPYWRAFYQLCVRNDCFVGPAVTFPQEDQDLSSTAQAVSKMEMEYRAKKERDGGEDEEREIDVTVGRMVTLLDEGED
ncbi:DEAD/DEAH box helicase family protein [Sporobolomyces salmoneus]|uniref:DEAD/DEAH box helicase family protein n=1 Tax=Sporobolomyces salmoneus TaxID=183962 RepID=UPI00316C6C95